MLCACRRAGRRALSSRGAMNVFDREAKRRQKNRAAASPDAETYDYLRNEARDHYILPAQIFLFMKYI